MMIDLIQELINKMNPAYKKLRIIAADGAFYKTERISTSLENFVESRMHGDRHPVVIYGFDSLERVKKRQYGSIMNEEGIFYLQLPIQVEQICSILDKAINYRQGKTEKIILHGPKRIYAIETIRAFKHRCDNLWMSMQSDLNLQKKANNAKREAISVESIINRRYIERFSKEYEDKIENLSTQIGLKKANKIPTLFSETIKVANKYNVGSALPVTKDTLADLSVCINKIKMISEILSAAKEMAEHD
jgi:hypothetical protein